MGKDRELTAKQKVFVDEYLIDLNATQAAIRAGYSPKNADKIGPRLVGKSRVLEAIQARKVERAKRTEVTQDMVVNELRRIAFLDPRKVMSWGPDGVTLIDSDSLKPDEAACVAEASQTISKEGGSIRLKLCDKLTALEKLGKHLGMFVDRIEANVNNPSETVFYRVELPIRDTDDDIPAATVTS